MAFTMAILVIPRGQGDFYGPLLRKQDPPLLWGRINCCVAGVCMDSTVLVGMSWWVQGNFFGLPVRGLDVLYIQVRASVSYIDVCVWDVSESRLAVGLFDCILVFLMSVLVGHRRAVGPPLGGYGEAHPLPWLMRITCGYAHRPSGDAGTSEE